MNGILFGGNNAGIGIEVMRSEMLTEINGCINVVPYESNGDRPLEPTCDLKD